MMHLGAGYYVEYPPDKALGFVKRKIASINQQLEYLQKRAAEIKSHIRMTLEVSATVKHQSTDLI